MAAAMWRLAAVESFVLAAERVRPMRDGHDVGLRQVRRIAGSATRMETRGPKTPLVLGGGRLGEDDAGEFRGRGCGRCCRGRAGGGGGSRVAGRSVWPVTSGMATSWPPRRLGDADLAAAADERAGGGGLAEDVVGRDARGVETIFDGEIESQSFGGVGGCVIRETGEGGDVHLAAMDGETHGGERGNQSHDEHGEGTGRDGEDALHALDRIQGRGKREEGREEGREGKGKSMATATATTEVLRFAQKDRFGGGELEGVEGWAGEYGSKCLAAVVGGGFGVDQETADLRGFKLEGVLKGGDDLVDVAHGKFVGQGAVAGDLEAIVVAGDRDVVDVEQLREVAGGVAEGVFYGWRSRSREDGRSMVAGSDSM